MTPSGWPRLAYTLPEGWVAIGLPRSGAEAAAASAALAAAYPGLAGAEAGLERLIMRIVSACATANVLDAHVTVVDTPAGPLPATLVASASPLGTETVEALARDLAYREGASGPRVSVIDLPAGRAVRAEWLRQPDAGSPGRLAVQYLLEIAEGGVVWGLTFATPATGLASQLRPRFHQIARGVRRAAPGQEAGAVRAGTPC
jgi:hypothetical protein